MDYSALAAYIKEANLSLDKDKELEKDLQSKFANLSSKKKEAQLGVVAPLNKNAQKNVGHHVFVISIAIATMFFLFIVVLLFLK